VIFARLGSASRSLGVVVALTVLSLAPLACGADATNDPQAAELVSAGAVIVDVRTPEEFAAGHLDGALLIDIKNPSFDAEIAKLDAAASYIVYCRSGNRSAQAADRMRAIGIENITDLGSLENASAQTGVAIVQG
jgi:rhodanese-related sulfurtransferase